jgi:hypothetical protein
MNKYDIAGLLKTYSEKCLNARNSEQLKEIIRELKSELNVDEIKKLKVDD